MARLRPSREREASSTSSQWSGVDTVGSSMARSDHTHTVVLWASFWLQSTSTLPARKSLRIEATTSSGRSRAKISAKARAQAFAPG